MTPFQSIVIGLLVAVLARTFAPPLGADSTSNKALVVITGVGALTWAMYEGLVWSFG